MDRRHLGRRAVSLVLALELLLSPVAMARAADPARNLAVPETPLGDEVLTQDLPNSSSVRNDQAQAQVLEGDERLFDQVQITSNQSFMEDIEEEEIPPDDPNDIWALNQKIANVFYRLRSADLNLNVEIADKITYNISKKQTNPLRGTLWPIVGGIGGSMTKTVGQKSGEDSRYTYLPATVDARVPDMKFDGYALTVTGEDGGMEKVRFLDQNDREIFLEDEPAGVSWGDPDDPFAFDPSSRANPKGQLVRLRGAYDTVVAETDNDYDNYLPLTAWFTPSDQAKLTALGVTAHGASETVITGVYAQDPLTAETIGEPVPLTDFTDEEQAQGNKAGTEFVTQEGQETQEMWIQVGRDQTSLDLHFQTYEPYYSYTKDDGPQEGTVCPVAVTYSLDGIKQSIALVRGENMECQFLPRPQAFQYWERGANSTVDRARGDWEVKGIPLTSVENANPAKVDITLTVTAPDGATRKTYVIHIQRRQNPAGKHTVGYGNTPFGMIARDDATKWNDKITKDLSRRLFKANNLRFSDRDTRPTGPVNQTGGIYQKSYFNCWPGAGEDPDEKNVDFDETAIVAYQDTMFQDPGVTFTDSFGRDVDLENDLYKGTVTRTIQLQTPKSGVLSADSWTLPDALIETCWYNENKSGKAILTDDNENSSQFLTSLNQRVDLRGLAVLPGIYDIYYVYTDPFTDATTLESGDKPSYNDIIRRTLVVLPIPGDVDMDGAVTTADAYAMKNLLAEWNSGSSDRLKLAIGRVFDLNSDGDLDAKDYQTILNDGYQPELLRSGPVSDYFYLPLPAGDTGYVRKTWDQVESGHTGKLTLEFLGVEQGTRNGAYTEDPHGPFDTKTDEDGLVPVSLKDQETGEDNSVFWMGVKLEESPLSGQYIENFSLSLTYDSRYVEPAEVYTSEEKSNYESLAGTRFDGWGYTFRKYNLRDTADQSVIWSGSASSYDETGSAKERSYQTHYSKVVGEMEQKRGTSPLREMVVTLRYQSSSAASHVSVKDGYLLVVPFKLKMHPPKEFSAQARLIELSAGMRDLTLVTSQHASSSFLATLFGLGRSAGEETTYAFSAQEKIYGGSTQNLRDDLSYDAASGTVPIGTDNTARENLPNGTYGVAGYDASIRGGDYVNVIKDFPPGLTYNAGTGKISGTPLKPGTYEFEIGGTPYRIVIEPKTIHYRPLDADSYYGEPEYRGSVTDRDEATKEDPRLRNFTFQYNTKDLCDADRNYAREELGLNMDEEWRDGAELELILNRTVQNEFNERGEYTYEYTAPGFTAFRNINKDPVLVETVVGDYTLDTTEDPSSTCYDFYKEKTAKLTVVPRPVRIDYITATAEDSGLSIYSDRSEKLTNCVLYDKEDTTRIVLTLPELEDGEYSKRPLTGAAKVGDDKLAVTYSGQFLRDPTKGDTNTSFQMNARQEERQVEPQDLKLLNELKVDGRQITLHSKNYTLVEKNAHSKAKCDIKGIVIVRGVAEMVLTAFPQEWGLDNTYGDVIMDPAGLMVQAKLGEGSSNSLLGAYAYNSPDLFPLVIHYNWVTPEEYAEGSKAENMTSLVGSGVGDDGKDTRPYGYSREADDPDRRTGGFRNNYLYPDMNGWRVCACVTRYVGEQEGNEGVQYIKCYTPPIKVEPKTLTITAKSARRFYGEELKDGLPDFTFRSSDLAARDQAQAHVTSRGTSEELKRVFDILDAELKGQDENAPDHQHVMPQFRMEDDKGEPVTATTPIVPGKTYKIVIYGAKSPCYNIRYAVQTGETTTYSNKEGAASLIIQPRPIVVKAIRGNGEDGNFTNIYADTKNLVVRQDPESKEDLVAAEDKVEFVLPSFNPDRGTTSYYTATGNGNLLTDTCTFPAGTTNALVSKDGVLDDVRVKYQVRFLPDEGCYAWTDFTQGFFKSEDITAGGTGYLNKNLQVEKMELIGKDSGNYVMVFADDVSFQDQVPSDAVKAENCQNAPANNNKKEEKQYYVSGTGRVYLRPIKDIVITSLGQMAYAYGDQFAPNQPGGTDGKAMTVQVQYDQKYDNDPKNNFNIEDVDYRQLRRDETGKWISTFDARGFVIYYVKPGQTREDAEAKDQRITDGVIMLPGAHNGAKLFVTGRRSARDEKVYSIYAPTQEAEALKVDKATLTLTAESAHKFYGEPNPEEDYTFTFDTRQLAQVDQDKLRDLNGGTLARQGTKADLLQLDSDANFGGLRFTTNATTASTVGINGKWGEYDLKLTTTDPKGAGVLTNYNVVTESAHLYVYPRPVRVTKINSDQKDPVYTIFNDTGTFSYHTEMSTANRGSGLAPRVEVRCGADTPVYTVSSGNSGDGRPHDLPLTTSLGLIGEDALLFSAKVEFPSGWTLSGTSDALLGVQVTELKLIDTTANRNYALRTTEAQVFGEMGNTTPGTVIWGAGKERTIREISIVARPNKLEYTYGEPLDLTGLKVWVTYDQMDEETNQPETVVVDYIGSDQFQSMGLYVNYWTPNTPLPTDDVLKRALPGTYWTASTGDHVTIAYTHDTQRYLSNPGATEKSRPFATNGKYLVVSGFQKAVGNKLTAAEPKILGEETASGICDGTPIPIKVNPLKLRYTLHAEDKTYDGDTKAAGSLTLTNIYGSGSSADAVYVPMGADYEKTTSKDHNDFGALKLKVSDGRITFSTGTYTPNREAPLLENGKTNWASGYVWGTGLTFTFPNPNVHYVDDSGVSGVGTQEKANYWKTSQSFEDVTRKWDSYKAVTAMPVEVTNMVLAGPDAANYTWDWDSNWTWSATNSHQVKETKVLMTTRSAVEEGQAATPFATIHKANRAPIQTLTGYSGKLAQLTVDRATNVVRLTLDQALSALGDNNNGGRTDEFRNELHFEYALLYAQTGEDGKPTGLLAQWAGRDGQKAYQDTTFFGGEAVTPTPTAAGFQPTLDRLPKIESKNDNTIYKGQLYQWVELDKGVVEVGGRAFREDSGFALNPAAYPGGATLTDKDGNEVKAENAYWYYTLYSTDRANLPRDTVFYPLVRLAETHNYNASGNLSGDSKVTAALLDAAQKALAALANSETEENLTAAQAASQAVLNAAKAMETDAKAAAKAQMDFDAELGESGKWPETQPAPKIGPAAAIKTLTQRLDLVSASTERSQDNTDTTEYLVELLEAVWFTDTLLYEEEKFLSAAIYNHPVRYYGYFWDQDMSARVEFNEKALNFTEELVVPVRVKQEDGSTIETTMTVNLFDETLGGRVAKLYVQITNNTGRKVRKIQILPTALYARLGDAPYQLTCATDPEKPTNRRYRWTSSDPTVATVDENGLVTFRGVGTCTITVSTDNEKFSAITVTVSEVLPFVDVAKSIFNFHRNEAWMELDEDGNFYPELPMTRAQVVELLDLFLNPNGKWGATTELPYVDVTGEEEYADALRRLTGAKVVTGLPDSAFGGSRLITRAEFATMLARMLRLDTPDTKGRTHQFLDAGEEETWAYRYIDALGMTGVTKGTGGGNFSPSRLLTREEAAAMIARLLTVKLDMDRPSLNIPADMTPTNWSYQYVLQAINTIVFPDPVVEPPVPKD